MGRRRHTRERKRKKNTYESKQMSGEERNKGRRTNTVHGKGKT